jgi:capsular polysaccharide biosynthesis protein
MNRLSHVEHFNVSLQQTENYGLHEQASWFAAQHIIIAAHGAALTNSIFFFPNTTVVQLYPFQYYFPGYFESLVIKVGGSNVDWYPVSV